MEVCDRAAEIQWRDAVQFSSACSCRLTDARCMCVCVCGVLFDFGKGMMCVFEHLPADQMLMPSCVKRRQGD